jgi:hypothetical protein
MISHPGEALLCDEHRNARAFAQYRAWEQERLFALLGERQAIRRAARAAMAPDPPPFALQPLQASPPAPIREILPPHPLFGHD